ncbi:MAG: ABC transporter ATP-binding protein [Hyphomicrobiales bacterium]|nr:ABC transporter ATP-binding protein [Hyphomicrobiales bacterium]
MLNVKGVCKRFHPAVGVTIDAVNTVSFDVPRGQFFTLLGPSGCGKTTILRMIAGLERPDEGTIALEDRQLFCGSRAIDIPANRRNLGMVFQSYAIWPHMTVLENVAFPLLAQNRALRLSRSQITAKAEAALSTVDLTGFENRSPTTLSGGQQQRLALARAIVPEPDLVLLDEPLSNLDAKLRDRMRHELRRLQQETGLTMVYVTHDQAEALALSDAIAVMDRGRILQCGAPADIYSNPSCEIVARFIGKGNFFRGTVAATNEREWLAVKSSIGDLRFPGDSIDSFQGEVLLMARPEDLELHTESARGTDLIRARVVGLEFHGPLQEVTLSAGDLELLAYAPAGERLAIDDRVGVRIDPEKIRLIDRTGLR